MTGSLRGRNSLSLDPRFADADLSLADGSPCIDAGSNDLVPADGADLDEDGDPNELTPVDLAGQPRFIEDAETNDTGGGPPPIVDMGAFEASADVFIIVPAETVYVREGFTAEFSVSLAWNPGTLVEVQCSTYLGRRRLNRGPGQYAYVRSKQPSRHHSLLYWRLHQMMTRFLARRS